MSPRRFSLVRNDGAIWIDGRVAPDAVSAAALRRSLLEVDEIGPVRVVIETPGGECPEGFAIYTALRESERSIHVKVRRAGSMGSVIAMAGERISIVEGGSFFLHHTGQSRDRMIASGIAVHMTASGLRELARRLDRHDAVALDILHRRTRLDRGRLAELHAADTTLDAREAVALGFADEVVPC